MGRPEVLECEAKERAEREAGAAAAAAVWANACEDAKATFRREADERTAEREAEVRAQRNAEAAEATIWAEAWEVAKAAVRREAQVFWRRAARGNLAQEHR